MPACALKSSVSLLDDKIDTLNRIAVEAPLAKQVFRIVIAILALVRVSALFFPPSVNSG